MLHTLFEWLVRDVKGPNMFLFDKSRAHGPWCVVWSFHSFTPYAMGYIIHVGAKQDGTRRFTKRNWVAFGMAENSGG